MIYFAKWKIITILGICLFGLIFAAPNFLSSKQAAALPSWLPHKQVSLGLDLQGGSHLLLEVAVDSVLTERLESVIDTMRTTLRKARIRYGGLGVDGLSASVTIKDASQAEQARQLMRNLDVDFDVEISDNNRITMKLKEQAARDRRTAAIEQSIEIVRRRIDETGVREPTIQRQGEDRILVQLPGLDDPERVKRLLGKTAKLSFHLVDEREVPGLGGRVPPGSMLMPSGDQVGSDGRPRMYLLKKKVMLSGDTLIDSQPTFQDNQPVVSFRFDTVGGKRFGKVTTDNVNKLFAIVLDSKVISAPVIREPILGGTGVISGNFTVQGAQDLALLLRAGALPAPLTILEERSVGPGLGADSIAAGKIASIIGMALVIGFMVLVYGRFGLMADVALLANIVLIGAALSLLQATLTLPGIAGIVLTIGMAVDANVLVFERIREEVRAGRTPISSIDAGYSRAIKTIIDANVTTLIAAILLYQFGSGPVRGFAVTLAIGIVTSLFTAIMLTRLMVVVWLRKTRPDSLPI
ncbi:MAG: protein translocase subunit SecD [Rhodospirillaceae bacterium]|jgi:preprotein translocase subunit SecD|nr:protein translocase subunit SecD [Rhodospirillaceae bacterium]MBT5563910.1 protein translocase subunit SecD [Rhodospirillaceae bacterium]MBT6240886.1 protein translocase subunit SecD [Rhodospirillaceae bacterium]MBT7137353.1 protein translocase subunit SecD [Rhodospirillaceae bacterium]